MKTIRFSTFVLVLSFFAAELDAQKIADIARRERQRQERAESTVVFSNADTPAGRSVNDTAAASPNITQVNVPGKGVLDNKGRDEKYWRDTFRTARQDLERAKFELQVLELKLNELQTSLMRDAVVFNRENVIGVEIAKTRTDIAAAQQAVELAEQKIQDLETELRRSGAPAGWAR